MSGRDAIKHAPLIERKGWCPGALRPMQTVDGLLVRVRPRAGLFPLASLAVLAETALQFGSGEIDLTNRANLQLRGLSEDTYADALQALARAGLLDDNARAEAVRNVVVDPLFGLDPELADLRPLAAELELRLIETTALHSLPGKFGFGFQGWASPDQQLKPDITIARAPTPGSCTVQLDGARDVATVETGGLVAVLERLALAFVRLHLADPELRRMRDAVAAKTAAHIFASAELQAKTLAVEPADSARHALPGTLGPHGQLFAVGIGLPYGRITAQELLAICNLARTLQCADVRPSSSRVLVVPVQDETSANALLAHAQRAGLIVSNDDPRLSMNACPGAPACRSGTTNTRADAQSLLDALAAVDGPHPTLHLSGCVKGCAQHSAAGLTLVAKGGSYDVVADGTADGVPLLTGIAPNALAATVRALIVERAR